MSNPEGTDPSTFDSGSGAAGGTVTPGWYPDPQSGALRWWDGQQWGAYQEAGVPGTQATPAASAQSTAALAHYLGIIGFIGPLIILLTSGDKDPFIKDQSTEALNFHLTVLIGWLALSVISVVTCGIGLILFPVLWIAEIVFSIIGGMAASKGQWYRYPVNIRMVKV